MSEDRRSPHESSNRGPRGDARGLGPVREDEETLLTVLPRQSSAREVRVGAFLLSALLAGLAALFLLTDASTFRGRYILHTFVQDAGGIRRGDPVQMQGVNIGRIRGFELGPDGVRIGLEIEGEYGVPIGSRVVLRSGGILGGMVAELVPGDEEANLSDGDIIPGRAAAGFATGVDDLGARARTVLDRAQALLSPTTLAAVESGAVRLDRTLGEAEALLGGQHAEVAALVSSLRRAAAGLEAGAAGGEDVARAAARLDSLVLRLDEATGHLSRSSASLEIILARMERGDGTLGRLATDPALYEQLQNAAAAITNLATDIREDPRRYLDIRIF